MWLHLSLGKINLEKTIEGQRLSPRQAGRQACVGWPPGLQGLPCDCISQHYLALLCWFLQIIANSRPEISASFCSHSSHLRMDKYGLC